MRQHVNPLSKYFQLPLNMPGRSALFKEADKPIHLDIGSAKGEFLIELASNFPEWNFLGLEIREQLVNSSEKERKRLNLYNLRFLYCNVNVSLENWLLGLGGNKLKRVSIQFPDPWFKRKHFKRRVLNKGLLHSIAKSLSKDGHLFIQSDILKLIESMTEIIDNSNYFDRKELDGLKWLDKNPYDIYTDRERYVLMKAMPIYRAMYYRNHRLFVNS